jgi:hypothetical protein
MVQIAAPGDDEHTLAVRGERVSIKETLETEAAENGGRLNGDG